MKILLVEDNEKITKAFSTVLNLHNYDVKIASDGNKGLETILETNFDLVFLDLAMPGFDGFDFLKALVLKQIDTSNIVVFTATNLSEEEKNQLKELGIYSIVKKPVMLNVIKNIIENRKRTLETKMDKT